MAKGYSFATNGCSFVLKGCSITASNRQRRAALTVFLLFFCLFASAQRFNPGIVTGITATQIDGDGYAGFNKLGLAIGGFVNTTLSEKLTGQFEILYINKGSVDPPNPDAGKYNIWKIKLNYVEVPLVLKYRLKNRFKKFTLEGGISYGRLVKQQQEDANGKIPDNVISVGPFNKNEVGYHIGTSYQINEQFSFNFRSAGSAIPIYGKRSLLSGPITWGFFGGSYNIVLAFSLRYHFPTNEKGSGE